MRIGVVVAIGLAASVAHADDRAKLRSDAENYEKQAKQSGDAAAYVKCGQAYLDLYNRDPAAPEIDELLYNAGVCFQEGKSTGAALTMFQMIEKYAPRSRVAPKAQVRAAMALEMLGMLPQAADKLEQYAKRFAGEKDAYQALSDAVVIRRALGDDTRMIDGVRYFIRTFGTKKPAEAAEAMYSLTEPYRRKGAAELERHLRDFLKQYPSAPHELRLRATVELAESIWKRSCAAPTSDGLCVKTSAARTLPIAPKPIKATPASTRCGPPSAAKIAAVPRNPQLVKDAVAVLQTVERLALEQRSPSAHAGYFHARAKLLLADLKLEQYLGVTFPTGLDFSPERKRASEASKRRFDDFVKNRQQLGIDAEKSYTDIFQLKDATMSIAAAQRLAMISHAFATELQTGEIPKDVRTGELAKDKVEAFCDRMTEVAEPLIQRAITAYDVCLSKAAEFALRTDASRSCARERANLGPTTYPLAAELLPEPPLALPVFDEEPLRKHRSLPQPLRDQVEKFWQFYGATPIPNDKCLPLAQGFERIKSADAQFMAGMTYGRCARDERIKAKAAYAAALAIDPKHGKSISNLGELALRAGDSDGARAQWEKALAVDAKLFSARLGLATLGLRNYRTTTGPARKQLASEIETHVQNAAAVGDRRSALPYVQFGILALYDNKLPLAKYFAAEAEKAEPEVPHVLVLKAAIARADNNDAAAGGYLGQADAGTWKLPEASFALAVYYLSTRSFELANKALAQVTRTDYDVVVARGVLARGLGKLKDAEARYTEATKLDPARAEAHFNLGVLFKDHVAARATDPTAAKAALKKAADAFRRANTLEAKSWADDCDKAAALL